LPRQKEVLLLLSLADLLDYSYEGVGFQALGPAAFVARSRCAVRTAGAQGCCTRFRQGSGVIFSRQTCGDP
jgi:hypothetical protein